MFGSTQGALLACGLLVFVIINGSVTLWADLAGVGLNADVKFLLLGDFRQLPAVLDS